MINIKIEVTIIFVKFFTIRFYENLLSTVQLVNRVLQHCEHTKNHSNMRTMCLCNVEFNHLFIMP